MDSQFKIFYTINKKESVVYFKNYFYIYGKYKMLL